MGANGIVPASCELRTLSGGEEDVGDFGVTMFPTSHDVPCVGYRIHTPDNKTMTIATDLGVLTPPVHQALSGCDLVALESNYDLHMLLHCLRQMLQLIHPALLLNYHCLKSI